MVLCQMLGFAPYITIFNIIVHIFLPLLLSIEYYHHSEQAVLIWGADSTGSLVLPAVLGFAWQCFQWYCQW